MAITMKQIEEMKAKGKIRDYTLVGGRGTGKTALSTELPKTTTQKVPGHKDRFKSLLETFCVGYGMILLQEQRFHLVRKWRFDFLITGRGKAVVIEYEGLGFKKTGHTESDRYSDNCCKYNAAAVYGIPVLRYTYLNYEEVAVDLKEIFYNGNV